MRHKPTTHKLGFSLLELAFVLTIISIVIVGIAKGSKILQNAGLARAQSLTKSSPVIGMSNLVVWYESAMQNSFKGDEAIDGSSVGTWYNISPYVNQLTTTTNAAQSTPANQPTYVSSGINGLPAIKFTRGSNSLASGSDCMSIVSGFDNDTENVTVFIVWSPASLNAANDMALLEKWGGGVTAYPYVLRFNAGTSYIFSAYDQTVNPGLMDTATRTVGTPTLISASRIKNGKPVPGALIPFNTSELHGFCATLFSISEPLSTLKVL